MGVGLILINKYTVLRLSPLLVLVYFLKTKALILFIAYVRLKEYI